MPDRRPQWIPPPPNHSQPWADWVGHQMQSLRDQVEDVKLEQVEQAQELARRKAFIEAHSSSPLMQILSDMAPQIAKIAVGLIGLLAMWWITGQPPDSATVKTLLKNG